MNGILIKCRLWLTLELNFKPVSKTPFRFAGTKLPTRPEKSNLCWQLGVYRAL